MHTHRHIRVHMHASAHTRTHTHTAHTNAHTTMHTHTCTHAHTSTRVHTYVQIPTHVDAHTHAYIHTRMPVCPHTRIHVNTTIQFFLMPGSWRRIRHENTILPSSPKASTQSRAKMLNPLYLKSRVSGECPFFPRFYPSPSASSSATCEPCSEFSCQPSSYT